MKHWILFPDENAFYSGMGRELYELDKDYRAFCRKAEKQLKIPLHHALFYHDAPYPEHLYERQTAVMVVGLANYNYYRKIYPEADSVILCGRGMGLLTALVAAEAITLNAAANRLQSGKLPTLRIRPPKLPVYSLTHGELKEKEPIAEAVADALREKEDFVLPEPYPCLDIGPGRIWFDALLKPAGNSRKPVNQPVARLDEPGDPQFIWSGFQCRRLWNRDYCAKRMFGVAVSTPNRNDADDNGRADGQEKEMRELLKPLFSQPPQSLSPESFDRCHALLREIFAEKHTGKEEIDMRFRLLEQETLIPLSKKE